MAVVELEKDEFMVATESEVAASPGTNGSARVAAILEAVETFFREWTAWQRDERSVAIDIEGPLADAIVMLITVVDEGDWPESVRDVCMVVGTIGVEWGKYCGRGIQTGQPPHLALREKIAQLQAGYEEVKAPRQCGWPNVKSMRLIEKCDDAAIARACGCFENGVWHGPFFDQRQRILTRLIDQEVESPGSVLQPDMLHPRESLKRRQREEQRRAIDLRLERREKDHVVNDRKISDKRRRTLELPVEERRAKAIAYVRDEGATVEQAAKSFGFNVDQVEAFCREASIQPTTLDAIRRGEAPAVKPGSPVSNEGELSPDRLRDFVLKRHAEGLENKEIRDRVAVDLRYDASPQKISGIIRDAKLPAAKQTEVDEVAS